MYLPVKFAESRRAELFRLVREHPLGMLVTHTASGLEANHLPFLLDEERGVSGFLLAHVARANPVWQEVTDGAEVLVVFRGTQGYISPNWYPSKQETHRHVPTWNYEVVHAHGRIHVRDDEKFVRGVVARLTRAHEASEPQPWKMSDAPEDYISENLRQIVGIEVELTRVEGKRKLSQNRDTRDFEGAVSALEERGRQDLALAMKQALDK
ncbi:FMN-binding negative transcriptional regulator [Peristeroidobacter agariperforans]|uniref:FMN-binding negative transcriptional regulator n=1 Tax=Peristeroidobacter agariperforans TaxID=268404 RepID=UPI00101E1B35|nr:FMN-binding negative transcriptional regulator [Peristeroidobacter agariperforans]